MNEVEQGGFVSTKELSKKAAGYLRRLCLDIPTRQVGSAGNRQATDYFGGLMASMGYEVEYPQFDCIDWREDGARLSVEGESFEAYVSPYSLGCLLSAPLVVVSSVDELEAAEIAGQIVLLCGEIAKEQLMPKFFPFYSSAEHKYVIQLLEVKSPAAIIASTTEDPLVAGGVSPFPLIEDGDFHIPSVYMTAQEGGRLRNHAGKTVSLDVSSSRIPSSGCNVVARTSWSGERRIVFTAHIDSKVNTPGALDNASGVAILLLTAELLDEWRGRDALEFVAINGEDYYSAPGEVLYLEQNRASLDEILLNINMDGVGFRKGKTEYSFYECSAGIEEQVRKTFSAHKELVEGGVWYSGDHMVFALNNVPALALTSAQAMKGLAKVSHTPKDKPELVETAKLVKVAYALRHLVIDFDLYRDNSA
jgi:aminopeptidase YwaD